MLKIKQITHFIIDIVAFLNVKIKLKKDIFLTFLYGKINKKYSV